MVENQMKEKSKADTNDNLISIQIHLYATLTQYEPLEKDAYPISAGMTAGDVLSHLGVPEKTFKLIFINGHRADKDTVLSAGDRVGVFPPVGGG